MALKDSMAEALRLTRSGNLMEATALIQTALGSKASVFPTPGHAGGGMKTIVPAQVLLRVPDASEPPPSFKPASPAGEPATRACFEKRTYRGSQGPMDYWLYRPAKAVAKAPLIVMLHGCTQSAQDFSRGTDMNRLADEFGFMVAYPEQNRAANPQRCWNWFRPGDQVRERGEPAQLAGITREIIAEQAADPDRVYIAGLSAGGAAAAIMAAQYPDLFAAVGIHSGLACGAAHDLPSALAAMQRGGNGLAGRNGQPFVPVITFHGNRDATVNELNSQTIVTAASATSGTDLQVRSEKIVGKPGRTYFKAQHVDMAGAVRIEQWTIEGLGHAWSGGHASGTYTDPTGPDASRAMVEFFLKQRHCRSANG